MRRKDREVTNIIEILQIIEKAKVLHLALFDADYPYIVPLHYGYEYLRGYLDFLHALHKRRAFRLAYSCSNQSAIS